jgi:hypothetical protein
MIQTDFIGFTTEEDSRTEFVLVKVECAKNARVIEGF